MSGRSMPLFPAALPTGLPTGGWSLPLSVEEVSAAAPAGTTGEKAVDVPGVHVQAAHYAEEVVEVAGFYVQEGHHVEKAVSGKAIAGASRTELTSAAVVVQTIIADSDSEFNAIEQYAQWLNHNVFTHHRVDNDAVAAMAGLDLHKSVELFLEIVLKRDQLRNPSRI